MWRRRFPTWLILVAGFSGAVLLLAVIGFSVVLSGVYNVGAAKHHYKITDWLLKLTLGRSVAFHSLDVGPPPNLADKGLIRVGANHFLVGCAPCHGAPGEDRNSVTKSMYPPPPPLRHASSNWSANELFWIVDNGFKFTGMPAWPVRGRGDEVWALVAFLTQISNIDGDAFRSLTNRSVPAGRPSQTSAPGLTSLSRPTFSPRDCAPCHGDATTPPAHGLVPDLRGQSAAYLVRAMEEFADGRRLSGMMSVIAEALTPEQIQRVARHYAEQSPTAAPPRHTDRDIDPEAVGRGRDIAKDGIEATAVPPCLACHSGSASDRFPTLAGLSKDYIERQLSLWRGGLRQQSTYGAIMAPIARRLTEQQAADVAAFFASRPSAAEIADEARSNREATQ